jgi:hypothetical protein
MLDAVLRQINGVVYGALGAEGLVAYQLHSFGYSLGAAVFLILLGLLTVWLCWRWIRRRLRSVSRWGVLTLRRDGRQALARAAEIRRGCRRLRRGIEQAALDPRERRETIQVLTRFVAIELEQTLDALRGWLALGARIPSRDLERRLDEAMRGWSKLAPGPERSSAEERIARLRQQLALAGQTRQQRALVLTGLDAAAAALRTLEAELLSLGQVRAQALPVFRSQLGELADGFRQQRLTHLEYQVRPG